MKHFGQTGGLVRVHLLNVARQPSDVEQDKVVPVRVEVLGFSRVVQGCQVLSWVVLGLEGWIGGGGLGACLRFLLRRARGSFPSAPCARVISLCARVGGSFCARVPVCVCPCVPTVPALPSRVSPASSLLLCLHSPSPHSPPPSASLCVPLCVFLLCVFLRYKGKYCGDCPEPSTPTTTDCRLGDTDLS